MCSLHQRVVGLAGMPCFDSMTLLQTFQNKFKLTMDLYSEWKKCCVHLCPLYIYPVRGKSSLEIISSQCDEHTEYHSGAAFPFLTQADSWGFS